MGYITKQNPMQDALKKNKKDQLIQVDSTQHWEVKIWASRTPKQFLLHVLTVTYACKQMGLDTNFAVAKKAAVIAELDSELTKMEFLISKKKKIKKKYVQ